jgi:hypothetical protein
MGEACQRQSPSPRRPVSQAAAPDAPNEVAALDHRISPFSRRRITSDLVGRVVGPRGGRNLRSLSSVQLDQVLEDQLPPGISPRLDKQPTFRKPAKVDRRETEIFRKHTNLHQSAFIVAR